MPIPVGTMSSQSAPATTEADRANTASSESPSRPVLPIETRTPKLPLWAQALRPVEKVLRQGQKLIGSPKGERVMLSSLVAETTTYGRPFDLKVYTPHQPSAHLGSVPPQTPPVSADSIAPPQPLPAKVVKEFFDHRLPAEAHPAIKAMRDEASFGAWLSGHFAVGRATSLGGENPAAIELETLAQNLKKLRARSPCEAPFEKPMLMGHLLATVSGRDVALANKIFKRLERGLNLPAMIDRHPYALSDPLDQSVWHLAQLLAETGVGFQLLRKVGGCTGENVWNTKAKSRAARTLLQAVRHLHRAAAGDITPHSFFRNCVTAKDGPDDDLATKAVRAAHLVLTSSRSELPPADRGALYAWRQGFRTEEGNFARFKQGLSKLVCEHIPRAEQPRTYAEMLTGRNKSPLRPLKHGVQGVNRPQWSKVIPEVNKRLDTVLECIGSRLVQPELILEADDPIDMALRVATLVYWKTVPQEGREGHVIDMDALVKIAHQARRLIAAIPEPRMPAARKNYYDLKQQINALPNDFASLRKVAPFNMLYRQRLSITAFAGWDEHHELQDDLAFRTAVAESIKLLDSHDIRPRDMSPESLRRMLLELTDHAQPGGKLAVGEGIRGGANTGAVRPNVSRLLGLAFPLVPRVIFRRQWGKQVLMQINRSGHGGDIYFGTERMKRKGLGGGVFAGLDFAIFRVGGTLTIMPLDKTDMFQKFIAFRIPRRHKEGSFAWDDDQRKASQKKVINFLFDEAARVKEEGINAEETWNKWVKAFDEDDNVVVDFVDIEHGNHARAAAFEVGATAKVPTGEGVTPRIGLAVGIGGTQGDVWRHDRRNERGPFSVDMHRAGEYTRVTARAGITSSVSVPIDNGEVNLAISPGDIVGYSKDLNESGSLVRVRLVHEDGRLRHRTCFADTEFRQASDFIKALEVHANEWVQVFERRFADEPDELRRKGMARRELNRIFGEIRGNERKNQGFFFRRRLRRHAAQAIDANTTLASVLRAAGASQDELDRIEARSAEIVANSRSWMVMELKVFEQVSRLRGSGWVSGLVHGTAHTTAEGEHELLAQTVSAEALEDLDDRLPK
ncbi:hypothetical protein [Paraburkholderia sp. CI3]|uniref:hypothetical protein n=1 Tax=Paraburkholderia sp. CI3 TaxID=2991060 RepID=UPI003D1F5EA6